MEERKETPSGNVAEDGQKGNMGMCRNEGVGIDGNGDVRTKEEGQEGERDERKRDGRGEEDGRKGKERHVDMRGGNGGRVQKGLGCRHCASGK